MAITHIKLADAVYDASEAYAENVGDIDAQLGHLESALRVALDLLPEEERRRFVAQLLEMDLSPEMNKALQPFTDV